MRYPLKVVRSGWISMTVTESNQTTISSAESESAHTGLLVGRVVSIDDSGSPLIAFDEASKQNPVKAMTTVNVSANDIGKEVAISFAQNKQGMPIIMGVIRNLLDDVIAAPEQTSGETGDKPEVIVDGNKLELSAPEEVTIRCGKASITLNKDGKILVKGEHALNRISGAFKVKSGSVELN